MIGRDDIASAREELVARREALMARADEIREQFADSMDADAITMAAGLTLFSAGISWALTLGVRKRRGVLAYLLPVGLIAAGAVVAAKGAAGRRSAHILEAEGRVRDELAELDPLARVRILRDMAGEQLPFVRHARN